MNFPTFLLTIYRWFDGLPVFTYGTGDSRNPNRVQMREVDLSSGAPVDRLTTNGSISHIDDFPFTRLGVRHYLGGQSTTSQGNLYEYDEARQTYTLLNKIVPPSRFASPAWATSFKVFTWQNSEYATFQLLDGGGPLFQVNAEIWLTSVYENSTLRPLTPNTPLARRDPEFFLGESKAFLYYYGQPGPAQPYELHRVETGLTRTLPATPSASTLPATCPLPPPTPSP